MQVIIAARIQADEELQSAGGNSNTAPIDGGQVGASGVIIDIHSQDAVDAINGIDDLILINRYIANAGICSRREADKLIQAGAVQVNGKVVTELGTKVLLTDKISYGDQAISREKLKYVLLNKPKGFITTTDDPENRKTVMNLIKHACKERIYPVGRLDRNTDRALLFTNDGELTKRLSHPKVRDQEVLSCWS